MYSTNQYHLDSKTSEKLKEERTRAIGKFGKEKRNQNSNTRYDSIAQLQPKTRNKGAFPWTDAMTYTNAFWIL